MLSTSIKEYWNQHIHDLEITRHPVGTKEFFQDLAEYRFEKLHYLLDLIDFPAYRGRKLLEVGCGVGIDLARFAESGARVTGIDFSQVAIELANQHLSQLGLPAQLYLMDGETMAFADNTFDIVYAHGVLQYAADPIRMVGEIHRVLLPEGEAILMMYNKYSWLNLLSKLMNVDLEHDDAPILRKMSIWEFKGLLRNFTDIRIVPERFPVKTHLHQGLKATIYNDIFVKSFNFLPKPLVRPLGWHLMAFAKKGP